ncbi:hypothetical protein IFM89_017437 [Coptis chinensis]|uniref:Uncharacterized protein n=1 Tax=Coptis chinensis TaxID=261450 RepID=A0A835H753_9MAGN|nr:hypothetical protein IFM89_017437 [Coptis chinensis]
MYGYQSNIYDWIIKMPLLEILFQDIGIDQAQLFNVDIKDESLKRERKFSHTIPSSSAQSSPPNKKLHKGEASQETVGLSLSDELTELPNLKLCQEKTRSDFDGDRSGNQKKVADSYPPTIKGEPCDWSRSIYQVNYPQNSLAAQSSAHSTEPLGAHVHPLYSNNIFLLLNSGVSTDNQHTSQLSMAIISTEEPTKGNEAQEAMCLKEDENTGDQCHDALENGDNEIVMAALLNDRNSNLNVLENESLPFIKSSPGWKDVESNEIFRSMPQKPHFRPLQKKPELLREGKALGLMACFGLRLSGAANRSEKKQTAKCF